MEKVTSISVGVRTRALERAVIRLASDKYPARLVVIHRELERRKFQRAA